LPGQGQLVDIDADPLVVVSQLDEFIVPQVHDSTTRHLMEWPGVTTVHWPVAEKPPDFHDVQLNHGSALAVEGEIRPAPSSAALTPTDAKTLRMIEPGMATSSMAGVKERNNHRHGADRVYLLRAVSAEMGARDARSSGVVRRPQVSSGVVRPRGRRR
jgi:hypothetical protein